MPANHPTRHIGNLRSPPGLVPPETSVSQFPTESRVHHHVLLYIGPGRYKFVHTCVEWDKTAKDNARPVMVKRLGGIGAYYRGPGRRINIRGDDIDAALVQRIGKFAVTCTQFHDGTVTNRRKVMR